MQSNAEESKAKQSKATSFAPIETFVRPNGTPMMSLAKFHCVLVVDEKTENPSAEISPNTKPNNEPFSKSPIAMIKMPIVAIAIDIQTLVEILSFRNKKPNKAVINGIADKQSRVIAAVV